MIGLILAAGAFSTAPIEHYTCKLVANDGELIALSATIRWTQPTELIIENQSNTRKWPNSLRLVRTSRFGGQFASNLWEIVPEAHVPHAVVEHISFDTVVDGPRHVIQLWVRDDRLDNQSVSCPLARGDCALVDGIAKVSAQ